MAWEHVDRRWRYREVRLFGRLTAVDIGVADELSFAPEERPGRLLVDLLGAERWPDLSVPDTGLRIVSRVDRPPRTAFLVNRPVVVGALHQMIQFLGTGERMRVFGDREAALDWLYEGAARDEAGSGQ